MAQGGRRRVKDRGWNTGQRWGEGVDTGWRVAEKDVVVEWRGRKRARRGVKAWPFS